MRQASQPCFTYSLLLSLFKEVCPENPEDCLNNRCIKYAFNHSLRESEAHRLAPSHKVEQVIAETIVGLHLWFRDGLLLLLLCSESLLDFTLLTFHFILSLLYNSIGCEINIWLLRFLSLFNNNNLDLVTRQSKI